MFTAASTTDPLWATSATRPGSSDDGIVPMYTAERWPGEITPMQFGPQTAMSNAAATSASSAWMPWAAGPVSVNPPPGTTAARTPRAPAVRRSAGTDGKDTAPTTTSGGAGRSSSDGKHAHPRISS